MYITTTSIGGHTKLFEKCSQKAQQKILTGALLGDAALSISALAVGILGLLGVLNLPTAASIAIVGLGVAIALSHVNIGMIVGPKNYCKMMKDLLKKTCCSCQSNKVPTYSYQQPSEAQRRQWDRERNSVMHMG